MARSRVRLPRSEHHNYPPPFFLQAADFDSSLSSLIAQFPGLPANSATTEDDLESSDASFSELSKSALAEICDKISSTSSTSSEVSWTETDTSDEMLALLTGAFRVPGRAPRISMMPRSPGFARTRPRIAEISRIASGGICVSAQWDSICEDLSALEL